MHHLFKNVKVVSGSTSVASSTANITGNIIDCLGFRNAAFVFSFGGFTTAATVDCHVEGANTSATSDMIDIEDSRAAGTDAVQSAKLIVDLGRLKYRYYRPMITKGGAASVVNDITGLLYNPVQAAVSHSTALVTAETYLADASTGASTGS